MITNFKIFESKSVKDIVTIQDEYENLGSTIRRYLTFNSSLILHDDCYLNSFRVNDDKIFINYRDWNNDDINGNIDLDDFLLFYNDSEEYERMYKIRKETNKYNL